MNITLLAINDSLSELKDSLVMDQQMIRNMRTALVKKQEFAKITALKQIEEKLDEVMRSIDVALENGDPL